MNHGFLAIGILALVILTSACQPDFITAEALEPFSEANEAVETRLAIDALLLEHDARMADYASRLASSEEKIAFDATRAKRQLVGTTDSQRANLDNMIDVHIENARAEVGRVRARIAQFDAEARYAVAETLPRLNEGGADREGILASVRESVDSSSLEEQVVRAEEAAVRSAESVQNELNKLSR